MDRRRFLVTSLAGALAAPLAAGAQPEGKASRPDPRSRAHVPRIAFLGLEPTPALIEAFRQGLRELGYVEGDTIAIEWRFSRDPAQYAVFAAEMVRLNVDVIVTGGPTTSAARDATKAIPIVFAGISDPVRSGYVASLARPGGNVTGVPYLGVELAPKRLQLLKEAVSKIQRVAVLLQPGPSYDAKLIADLHRAAESLRLIVTVIEVRHENELDDAFARATDDAADGLLVVNNVIFYSNRRRIAELAAVRRLPGIYDLREYADVGGLMSYSPSLQEAFRRIATYVDKILKGAKPADLPIEQPTKFELVINMKTAKALSLTIPPSSLLLRADEVIR
jgi:putative tryptophan/tyrosine transport system substrate-binding protein